MDMIREKCFLSAFAKLNMRPLLLQQLSEPCHPYLYPIEKYKTSAHAVPRTDIFQFLMSKISRLSSRIYPVVPSTSLLRELKLSGLRFKYPNTLPPPSPRIEENTPCLLARIPWWFLATECSPRPQCAATSLFPMEILACLCFSFETFLPYPSSNSYVFCHSNGPVQELDNSAD